MRLAPREVVSKRGVSNLGCSRFLFVCVCWQAPDDYVATWTLADRDPEEQAELRQRTRGMATQIMKRRAGEDATVEKPKKKHRAKAYTTLQTIDNALRAASGTGLEGFLVPKQDSAAGGKEDSDPYQWRFLSLAPDQGPDVVAAVAWMQYKAELNADVTWDFNHGAWNDCRFMYADTKLWPHTLLMTSAQNVAFGSELSPNRLSQISQCFADYQKICCWRTCPIFHYFLPKILSEAGHTKGHAFADDVAQETWEALPQDPVLTSMGERVNLGRFFGSIQRSQHDVSCWSKRALVYTVAAMLLGYEGTNKMKKLAQEFKEKPAVGGACLPKEAEAKASLKSSAKAANIRSVAENQLHIASMMYSDEANRLTQQIALEAAEPVARWHSLQNKELRNLSGVQKFEIEHICTSVKQMLADVLQKIAAAAPLRQCGIQQVFRAEEVAELRVDAGLGRLEQQRDRAQLLHDCVFSLAYRRSVRLLHFVQAWPRCFVMLLSREHRKEYLELLQEDVLVWTEMKGRHEDWAVAAVKRSVFNLKSVQQIVRILDSDEWRVTAPLLSLLHKRTRRFVCSQLTEDGIGRVKRGIELSKNCLMREATVWGRLIDKKVLTEVHHYNEVQLEGEVASRAASLPHEWFKHPAKQPTEELRLDDITTGGSPPRWWSPGAAQMALPCVDLHILRRLHRSKELHKVPKLFFGNLVNCCTMVIRARDEEETPAQAAEKRLGWYFALGCACGSAAVAWPAVRLEDSAGLYFLPQLDIKQVHDNVTLLPIVDPLEWWAYKYQVLAPADVVKQLDVVPEGKSEALSKLRMKPEDGPPLLLWHLCARQGFRNLPLNVLKCMVEHFLPAAHPTSLLQHIEALVKHALDPAPAALAGILDGRIACMEEDTHLSKITELEEVADLMTKDEMEEVTKAVDGAKRKRAEKKELEDEYRPNAGPCWSSLRDFDECEEPWLPVVCSSLPTRIARHGG